MGLMVGDERVGWGEERTPTLDSCLIVHKKSPIATLLSGIFYWPTLSNPAPETNDASLLKTTSQIFVSPDFAALHPGYIEHPNPAKPHNTFRTPELGRYYTDIISRAWPAPTALGWRGDVGAGHARDELAGWAC